MTQVEAVEGYVKEVIDSSSIKYPPSVLVDQDGDPHFKVIVVLAWGEADGSRFLLRRAIMERIKRSGYCAKVLVFHEHQGE